MRRPGIEPGSQEWESCMIPLHQRRSVDGRLVNFGSLFGRHGKMLTEVVKTLPPERIELSTPGLQDQCSATEL